MKPAVDVNVCINSKCKYYYHKEDLLFWHRCKLLDKYCYSTASHNLCPIPEKCIYDTVMFLMDKQVLIYSINCSPICQKKD